MKVIWKQPFPLVDNPAVQMPAGAEVLSMQVQGERLFIWFLCDSTATQETRYFRLVGTGNPIDGALGRYISTVQDGTFVWHLFEARGPGPSSRGN